MANRIQRIGVLTGGGDCPGLNSEAVAHQKFVSQHSDLLYTAIGLRISLGNREVPLALAGGNS
jgi:hypothetical protein